MKRSINNFLTIIVIFLVLPIYAFAAGGGGGGGGGGGVLGFSSARDSILILVSRDYSEKFSLKNNTKYTLKIDVKDGNATVNFGGYYLELEEGDNFLDLNDNNLADINFNLVKIKGNRADVRIIDAKEQIKVATEDVIIKEPEIEEEEDEEEDEIKCAELKTIKERVSCRLEQEKEEQEEELQLYYLPEECVALSGASRGICIARYKSVQTCWKFPVGEDRVSCVKRTIRLGNLQEEKEKCNKLIGESKSVCAREIKNKNYDLIKWRFYDLEERAEDFMMRGLADKESVVDFIVKTEENKVKFNEADSKEERKNIILDVRNDWKDLVRKIRENVAG